MPAMPRGLDHIVHAVRDLESAADLYRRLGFTVGARNRQPREWGTQNHIVQTPDTFIELLAVVDDSGMAPHGPGVEQPDPRQLGTIARLAEVPE